MIHYREDRLSEAFTKYILDFRKVDGGKLATAIHHFTKPDPDDGYGHDHPFGFTSHILKGSYKERRFKINKDGTWDSEVIHRKQGDVFHVNPEDIHHLIGLPEGECFTMTINDEGVEAQPWRSWKFHERIAQYREYNTGEYKQNINE